MTQYSINFIQFFGLYCILPMVGLLLLVVALDVLSRRYGRQ